MKKAMKRIIGLEINGKPVELTVDIRQSLLEVLREQGFTGAKEGCGVGECGACTVLIDGLPIDSCISLAVWAEGKKIETIEGQAKNEKLSRVQQAYAETGAVQCGYCTPGLVMKTTEFLETHKDQLAKGEMPDRQVIRKEHSGNLCRCTGYQGVVDAVESCCKSLISEISEPEAK